MRSQKNGRRPEAGGTAGEKKIRPTNSASRKRKGQGDMSVEPAGSGTIVSPGRQSSSNGRDEHKSGNGKDLAGARQLVTDKAPATATSDDSGSSPSVPNAKLMLASPKLAEQIVSDVQALGVVGEPLLILMAYVTATARLLPRAIHLCVYGAYSTGKSFIINKVLNLFPVEDVYRATQVTSKHLLNLKEDDAERYCHKVIFIGELITPELGLAFREMAESGEVQNLTVRDGSAEISFAIGPVTFMTTTTLSPRRMKDEDASRMFYFPTDECEEQTDQVMEARARRAKGQTPPSDRDAIIAKHRAAQAILKKHANIEVIVPYADLIRLPKDDPHSRRLHDRILLLLETVTFLCQFREGPRREERGEVTNVYADERDWQIALPLIEVIVTQKFGLPDKAAKEFLEKVKPHGPGPFSIESLRKHLGMSDSTVRRRIRALPKGSVEQNWSGNKWVYTFTFDSSPYQAIGLPSVEEVRKYLRDAEKLAS